MGSLGTGICWIWIWRWFISWLAGCTFPCLCYLHPPKTVIDSDAFEFQISGTGELDGDDVLYKCLCYGTNKWIRNKFNVDVEAREWANDKGTRFEKSMLAAEQPTNLFRSANFKILFKIF